ncbi:T6SS phospholipase effector Tle1-like catalytic domain-containing protein [Marinobacter bohaiensis]|uniref:T6SS phospholipase effector Tle1-like catalytic domain-containing protein n=1 Tax=Marinobacter bohaiensis TaxID=2201898 RepID=UPI000DAB96BE|nr:DUF2235 domain-containing protein [Marinobacter bohaiensis]
MNIKRPRELVLSDLPRIESPTFAAHAARPKLDNPASPLLWDKTALQTSPSGRPLSDQDTADKIAQALSKGELLLVYSSIDGSPINPVVTWRESGSLPGRWLVQKDLPGLFLNQQVARLNDRQITPNQIERLGPEGIGHLSLSGFDMELRQREIEEKEQAQSGQRNNLSLPVGAAAAVAPVVAEASEEDTSAEKALHVEVGIFLDGTGNNEGNVKAFEEKLEKECFTPHRSGEISDEECRHRLALAMGTSYANGETNVSKLFRLYRESKDETDTLIRQSFRVYSPGVGTVTGRDDSLLSSASGLGEAGILNQIARAFDDAAALISGLSSDGVVDQVSFDLFGFSRGSAAARHAAFEISRGTVGMMGQSLKKLQTPWPQCVEIRFVGLFDTVAGIVNISQGDWSAGDSNTAPINVHLDGKEVKKAVQFAAADECRQTFALNSLRNANGQLPENFIEISLPGAHSDIGGGYHEHQTETIQLEERLSITGRQTEWPKQTMEWDNLSSQRAATIDQGWIGEYSLENSTTGTPFLGIRKSVRKEPPPYGKVFLQLEMVRTVLGEYSRVPLALMHSFAIKDNIPLEGLSKLGSDGVIPEPLKEIHKSLSNQIESQIEKPKLEKEQQQLLKQRYVHHSDNYNDIEFMIGDTITSIEIPWDLAMPFKPTNNRQRIIHPNTPGHS